MLEKKAPYKLSCMAQVFILQHRKRKDFTQQKENDRSDIDCLCYLSRLRPTPPHLIEKQRRICWFYEPECST